MNLNLFSSHTILFRCAEREAENALLELDSNVHTWIAGYNEQSIFRDGIKVDLIPGEQNQP